MTCRLGFLIGAVALAVTAAPAAAQQPLVFEFADDTGTAASTFTVTENQTIRLRVYLRERNAQGTVLTSDGGLGSAAVRVTYGAGSAATIVNPATDIIAATPPWDGGTTNGTNADSGALNLLSPSSQGVQPTNGRVFLGTFVFTGHRPGVVTLGAVDRNPASEFDTTTFTSGNPLDTMIDPGSATLTVVPVPEPVSVLAVGVAGLAGLGAIRRGRRVGAASSGGVS